MARAVLEGVAFHIRWIVETIQALGVPLQKLNAIGGGATSDVWLQIIADITGLEVRVVKWAQEAGAVGAALTCAIGLGEYPDVASLEPVIQFSHTVVPIHDQRAERYDTLFRIYVDLFEALRPFNKALYPKANTVNNSNF
jgi:xylulokinase